MSCDGFVYFAIGVAARRSPIAASRARYCFKFLFDFFSHLLIFTALLCAVINGQYFDSEPDRSVEI